MESSQFKQLSTDPSLRVSHFSSSSVMAQRYADKPPSSRPSSGTASHEERRRSRAERTQRLSQNVSVPMGTRPESYSPSSTCYTAVPSQDLAGSKEERTYALPSNYVKTNPSNGSEGWLAFVRKLREYDENMIKDWKEEIDTLLVFAGLFSAVQTAFIIDTYKLLQPQTPDPQLIIQILSLLNSSSSQSFLASQSAAALSPSAVWINTLWFAGLVCSLVSASMSMLVKQWLREYLAGSYTSPREVARVQQYRRDGLTRWRVPEIMALLPLLLQLALLLFLGGLVVFVWSLHPVVASVVTALTITWLLCYGASTCLPTLFPSCPYRSPQARTFYTFWRPANCIMRVLRNPRRFFASASAFGNNSNADTDYGYGIDWVERERAARADTSLEVSAMVSAEAKFVDDDFLESTVRQCLRDFSGANVVSFLQSTIAYRLRNPSTSTLTEYCDDLWQLGERSVLILVNITLDALNLFIEDNPADRTERWGPWIGELLEFIPSAMAHVRWHRGQGAVTFSRTADGLVRLVNLQLGAVSSEAFSALVPMISDPHALPWLPSGAVADAWSSIIDCATAQIDHHDPLQLCYTLIALGLHTSNDELKNHHKDFRALIEALTSGIETEGLKGSRSKHHRRRSPLLDHFCHDLAGQLNARYSGLINSTLFQVLSLNHTI